MFLNQGNGNYIEYVSWCRFPNTWVKIDLLGKRIGIFGKVYLQPFWPIILLLHLSLLLSLKIIIFKPKNELENLGKPPLRKIEQTFGVQTEKTDWMRKLSKQNSFCQLFILNFHKLIQFTRLKMS